MSIRVYTKFKPSKSRGILQFISYSILITGMGMLFWAYYPMISFELYSRYFLKNGPTSPIPLQSSVRPIEMAKSVLGSSDYFTNNLRDFTQADLWFPVKNTITSPTIDIREYTLSIPTLNLKDLKVLVGGEDLSKSLIHYLPTSKPGQYGKIAIFGHSTLPQLFNSKDYKTVFTYLPKLSIGDTVQITSEGRSFEYEIFDMYVVQPNDISVLEQNFNSSYLMLVTCVPPGTYKERLIVEAKLKKNTTF